MFIVTKMNDTYAIDICLQRRQMFIVTKMNDTYAIDICLLRRQMFIVTKMNDTYAIDICLLWRQVFYVTKTNDTYAIDICLLRRQLEYVANRNVGTYVMNSWEGVWVVADGYCHFFVLLHGQKKGKGTMKGLVIRTTGSWYRVLPLDGGDVVMDCRLRGNYRLRGNKQTNPVAVGDRVDYMLQVDGTGVITDVADRANYIVRKATKLSKQTHVIAANIDLLCVVATLGLPRTSTGFIDRLLATAEAYHIAACVVFNKTDLYDDEIRLIHDEVASLYMTAGYPVYAVSALTGSGIEELRQAVAGRVTLFSGHSGVGKSALLNALSPGLDLRVGSISDWSLKGKHTTTFAEIYPIALGDGQITYLIDTPGIKEFGMVDFKREELSHFFPELRKALPGCRFANCTHTHEPGCAVKQAVEEGRIAAERYHNYLNILESIEE